MKKFDPAKVIDELSKISLKHEGCETDYEKMCYAMEMAHYLQNIYNKAYEQGFNAGLSQQLETNN